MAETEYTEVSSIPSCFHSVSGETINAVVPVLSDGLAQATTETPPAFTDEVVEWALS